jgi:transposase
MQDRDLYARILGLTDPWRVVDVKLDVGGGEVRVRVEAKADAQFGCPECGNPSAGYDTRERSWRHLDTCQFKTILTAPVPRVRCDAHGVRQVNVPWAEPNSGFTALLEAVVIDWLRSLATIKAVAEQLRLSWDEVDGIMQRAVARGLGRRKPEALRRLGIDETAFQRRHEYVTVVTNHDGSRVVHVADDRTRDSVDAFLAAQRPEHLASIESVTMDMWKPYIASVRQHVPDADSKIAFDKFHVVKHLVDAVDKVRRAEHRELLANGDGALTGARFVFLTNIDRLSPVQVNTLDVLRRMSLRTVRAWGLKEAAANIWRYIRRSIAESAWREWTTAAMRSRLEPLKRVARMIRTHLRGIVNGMALRATNAVAESVNARIQKIKAAACGFRNRGRFRNAIMFHLGGLDLYPAGGSATHTSS